MELITSRSNNTIKLILELISEKKTRREQGLFWVHRESFIAAALHNGWELEKLVYVPELLNTKSQKQLLHSTPESKRLTVTPEIFNLLVGKGEEKGLGAILKSKVTYDKLQPGLGVVLENISNPGNLGMIMRALAAFKIKNLYIINPAVDPFHPEAVRSSMDGMFQLNLIIFNSLEKIKIALAEFAEQELKFKSIGTSLSEGSLSLQKNKIQLTETGNNLIWFGNERNGLSSEAEKLCEQLIKIEMSSEIDSLNVAQALAIVAYEVTR